MRKEPFTLERRVFVSERLGLFWFGSSHRWRPIGVCRFIDIVIGRRSDWEGHVPLFSVVALLLAQCSCEWFVLLSCACACGLLVC